MWKIFGVWSGLTAVMTGDLILIVGGILVSLVDFTSYDVKSKLPWT